MVRFLLNNEAVTLQDADADLTVLNYLRDQRALTGTKEGCAAGDCGACTVVVAELNESADDLHYRTINSCIALMSALDGKQLITVEHLTDKNTLHPVQQALVDNHASQCGFCTPGFVMSTFALYQQNAKPGRAEVIDALSGNLCRCTGYRPIIDAATQACSTPANDKFSAHKAKTITALKALGFSNAVPARGLLMPDTREALAKAIASHPDAPLVAGSTDLSLAFTQRGEQACTLISLAHMDALKTCTKSEQMLSVGAATPLSDIGPHLLSAFPTLSELFIRFASLPIRNQATLGGNIANASPIGDMPPVMLALNATFVADDGTTTRDIPVDDFFTGYRQTALKNTEWLSRIDIPLLKPEQRLAAYKISKRMEDDISAVCAVFNLTLNGNTVVSLRTGFGGVAATPTTCDALEKALIGKDWSSSSCVQTGKQILLSAFTPLDDVRASAQYRKTVLANLWHRFWLENQSATNHIETRVVNHA